MPVSRTRGAGDTEGRHLPLALLRRVAPRRVRRLLVLLGLQAGPTGLARALVSRGIEVGGHHACLSLLPRGSRDTSRGGVVDKSKGGRARLIRSTYRAARTRFQGPVMRDFWRGMLRKAGYVIQSAYAHISRPPSAI